MKRVLILIMMIIGIAGCTPQMNVGVVDGESFSNVSLITEEYVQAICLGQITGSTCWNKFGYNNDIDTSTSPEIIAEFGGTANFFLSSAETLDIISSDVDDINGGSGAYSIIIYGVNNDWEEIIDVVSLNGTNTVQSNLQFLGINRLSIYQSGSSEANEGTITVTAATSGNTQGNIPASSGTSQQAFFFVPANHTFLATDLVVNTNKLGGGSTPKITIVGYAKVSLTNARYEVYRKTIDTNVENSFQYTPNLPFVVGEKQILYFTASTDTNNAQVNFRFSGITVLN